MQFHEVEYLLQFMDGESVVVRKANRIEPELSFALTSLDMNVRWFVALMGVEVEPITVFAQDCRHDAGTIS
jgi:hypothetical protein